MKKTPFDILKIKPTIDIKEIKLAYRKLVKIYHPDKGGDDIEILEINKAWEALKDKNQRLLLYEEQSSRIALRNKLVDDSYSFLKEKKSNTLDKEVQEWIKNFYQPIDKLMGEIINKYQSKIKDLSADPYDDDLMNTFSSYLTDSNKKIEKIHKIFSSLKSPYNITELGLDLYHCLSKVEDGINELEKYTMGYVDNYLHDGKEMLREAKRNRKELKDKKKILDFI